MHIVDELAVTDFRIDGADLARQRQRCSRKGVCIPCAAHDVIRKAATGGSERSEGTGTGFNVYSRTRAA